jgi:hypothetical protein
MTITELFIILALVGYAIYQQTKRHEVHGSTRFKLAIIYGAVGLLVGGMHLPKTGLAVLFLVVSIVLSLVVGQIRGRLTRLWREGDTVFSQGTAVTVGIFLALIASKFALGTVAYFMHVSDDGGIGEVMLMIGLMMAVQAELIWRRAQRLLRTPRTNDILSHGVTRAGS